MLKSRTIHNGQEEAKYLINLSKIVVEHRQYWPLECVESFKYLGLEVPSNHKWNECATRRLEAGKRAYYAFENMYAILGILNVGSSRNIFSTLW